VPVIYALAQSQSPPRAIDSKEEFSQLRHKSSQKRQWVAFSFPTAHGAPPTTVLATGRTSSGTAIPLVCCFAAVTNEARIATSHALELAQEI
jgi:hypothetical protein